MVGSSVPVPTSLVARPGTTLARTAGGGFSSLWHGLFKLVKMVVLLLLAAWGARHLGWIGPRKKRVGGGGGPPVGSPSKMQKGKGAAAGGLNVHSDRGGRAETEGPQQREEAREVVVLREKVNALDTELKKMLPKVMQLETLLKEIQRQNATLVQDYNSRKPAAGIIASAEDLLRPQPRVGGVVAGRMPQPTLFPTPSLKESPTAAAAKITPVEEETSGEAPAVSA